MPEAKDEQTREERLEIARRYRERRGDELRALAAPAVDGKVEAAGEFSSVATEGLAAVPLLGMFMLPYANWRSRRAGLPPKLLLALDAEHLHALELRPADVRRDLSRVTEAFAWPRSEVSMARAGKAFMRDRVSLAVPDRDEPIDLYAPTLTTNPWSAEVVRLLGGDAPEPLDLSV